MPEPGRLEVSQVHKRLGGIDVIADASFRVPPGTLAALVGPNGSGKTTILRMLAGILRPDAGSIWVCAADPRRGRASLVLPGDRGLQWRLTGRQNLDFFAGLRGYRKDERSRRVDRFAQALGAEDLLDRRVGICSSGERRRLAIATGFVAGCPVVLLDEPTADLDPKGIEHLARLTQSFTASGGVILCASPVPDATLRPDATFHVRRGRPTITDV